MKYTLLSLFLFLATFGTLKAQEQPVINGPETLCIEECGIYQIFNFPGSSPWYVVTWVVIPNDVLINTIDSISAEICFYNYGSFQINAIISDNLQQLDTIEYIVFVEEGLYLEASLTSSSCNFIDPVSDSINGCPYYACENTEVVYQAWDQSLQRQLNGNWTVSGAQSFWMDGLDLHILWGDAGIGTIFFQSLDHCFQYYIETCVEILPDPEVQFDAIPGFVNDQIEICTGQNLYFDNLSTGGFRYEWNFGDGVSSDEFEPSHSYDQPGTYDVTLKVYNQCECFDEIIKEVTVLPAAAPELSCLATTCPGENQRYEAFTDGCATFFWNVSSNASVVGGGGLDDDYIEVIWNSGPDGIIELQVDNCNQAYCSQAVQFRVPVVSENGPIEGDQSVCSGEVRTYSIPDLPGATYSWNVSSLGNIIDGQNTQVVAVKWSEVALQQNDEWISVSYDHCFLGCAGGDTLDVSITPNLFVTGESDVCFGSVANFQAKSGFFTQNPMQVWWSLFDQMGNELWTSAVQSSDVNINMNYPPGGYYVQATSPNTGQVCVPDFQFSIRILPLPENPISIEGPDRICPGTEYAFTAPSSEYKSHWRIIDGGSEHLMEGSVITHTFVNSSPYSVELWYSDLVNTNCQSGSTVKQLIPADQNTISGLDEACAETFTTYSTEEIEGSVLSWIVSPADIADIKIDDNAQATFFWNYAGNAQITLINCGSAIVKNVTIHPKPDIELNHPEFICANEQTQVSTSVLFDQYRWKDESGLTISTDPTPMLYAGYYSVEATNAFGCAHEVRFQIKSYQEPTAFITTPGDKAFCNIVPDIPIVANTDGTNYHFRWYKNGVEIPASDDPTLIVDTFGLYQVEVTNQFGCSSLSNIMNIFEYCGPRGGVCNGQTCGYVCAFPDSVEAGLDKLDCNTHRYYDTKGNIISGTHVWEIEDPSTGIYKQFTAEPLEYTFEKAGYYTIILTGKLDGFVYPQPNCFHYYAFIDTIPLAADFRNDIACAGTLVNFEDLTTFLPDYGITSWEWNFGDPLSGALNTSTDQHPQHQFSQSGLYDVSLIVTSTSGCTSEITRQIEVKAQPHIIISSPEDACENTLFELSIQDKLFNILWDFDDPASGINDTASNQYVSHVYSNTGSYDVNVEAENIYGCRNDTSREITIFQNTLTGDITSVNGNPICEGDSTDLLAPGGGSSWIWKSGEQTETIVARQAGHYDVLIKDDHGCTYTPPSFLLLQHPKPSLQIKGREIYAPGDYGPWQDTLEVCEGIDLEVRAFSSADVIYQWSSGQTTPSLFFTDETSNLLSPGTYGFSVVLTDKNTNCDSDELEFTVIVHENPNDISVSIQSGDACSGTPTIIQIDNPQAGISYLWSDGQTGTSIEVEESGFYHVTGTSAFGCHTVSWNQVEIKKSPDAQQIPYGCFIECNPYTVCIPSVSGVADYTIYKDGLVWMQGSGTPNDFIVTETGSYEIELNGTNGCDAISAPLNLELYDGVGHIYVPVYQDINENGVFDTGDVRLEGIELILSQNNVELDRKITDSDGLVRYFDLPQGLYHVEIDTLLLPDSLMAIISKTELEIVGCDSIFMDSLLVGSSCSTVIGLTIDTTICPGDTLLLADTIVDQAGTYIRNLLTQEGCDSVVTYRVFDEWRGNILVTVYLDMNNNGLIDAADSLMEGISVLADHVGGAPPRMGLTGLDGRYLFEDLTHPVYIVGFDYFFIPPDPFIPLIDMISVNKQVCDTVEVDLLLGQDTTDLLRYFNLEICEGDSIMIGNTFYKNTGDYVVILPGPLVDTIDHYHLEIRPEIQYTVDIQDVCDGNNNGTISLSVNSAEEIQITWDHTSLTDSMLTGLASGNYSFTIYDSMCSVSDQAEIMDILFPPVNITPIAPFCPGGEDGALILEDISDEFIWSLDSINYTGTDSLLGLSSGTYTTYVQFGTCIQSVEVIVDDPIYTPIQLPQVVSIPINTPFEIIHNYLDSGNYEFHWTPEDIFDCSDCPFPVFIGGEEDVTISVTVTDQNGCEQIHQLRMVVEDRSVVYIPNAFSPNDDAVNDRFKAYTDPSAARTIGMMIFNRWGDKVYEEYLSDNNESLKGWDGYQNNKPMMPGVFVYSMEVEYANGKKETITGDVTLIR